MSLTSTGRLGCTRRRTSVNYLEQNTERFVGRIALRVFQRVDFLLSEEILEDLLDVGPIRDLDPYKVSTIAGGSYRTRWTTNLLETNGFTPGDHTGSFHHTF